MITYLTRHLDLAFIHLHPDNLDQAFLLHLDLHLDHPDPLDHQDLPPHQDLLHHQDFHRQDFHRHQEKRFQGEELPCQLWLNYFR